MSDKLRVAVAGAGRWAQRAHIPGWQRDPRVEVVALADTDPAMLAEAGERFGVKRLVTDYRELLDDPDIDVIDVATANRVHYEISSAALEAGKHVLCEKPVHHDNRQTRALAGARAEQGPQDQAGLHVPVRAGGAVRQEPDRRGLRRHAVHLQRVRAEQPVDRPGHPDAPGRPERRPGRADDLVDRGLRRADHRHHALVERRPT